MVIRRLCGLGFIIGIFAIAISGQETPRFEVASVKPSDPASQPAANVPVGPGDSSAPTGGLYRAVNVPLSTYIIFAYRLTGDQAASLIAALPDWAKNAHYDIEARAAGDPSRAEMRLLMQSLLADRFQLALHQETREEPVLLLVPAKTAKTGPNLEPYTGTIPCDPNASLYETTPQGLPLRCGGVLGLAPGAADRRKIGGRNVPLSLVLSSLNYIGSFGRPLVDSTGINGTVDFTLDWKPDALDADADQSDSPSLQQALLEQWGIKLKADRTPILVYVLDRIERPSEN